MTNLPYTIYDQKIAKNFSNLKNEIASFKNKQITDESVKRIAQEKQAIDKDEQICTLKTHNIIECMDVKLKKCVADHDHT